MKFDRKTSLIAIAILLVITSASVYYFILPKEKSTSDRSISVNSEADSIKTVSDITETDSITKEALEDDFESIETKEVTGKEIKLNDSISVTLKSLVPVGREDCEFEYYWEEIKFKNPKVAAEINKRTKAFVSDNLENCLGEGQPCNGCDLAGKVYYISPEMIGVALFASQPTFRRIMHEQEIFYLNPGSGKEIKFRDLLKPEKGAQFDSLLISKLSKQFELSSEDRYREQLPDISFHIKPPQITFTFYNEVGNWVMEASLEQEEVQPFLKTTFSKDYIR